MYRKMNNTLKKILIWVASIIVLLTIIALVWLFPTWLYTEQSYTGAKDLFDVHNETRKTAAQIVVGILLLAGLYLTHKRIKATEDQVRVSEEGQITERFTRAVEQLGNEKLEVRLGGIYALERIAKDSPKDHWSVMEVLSAYIREKAKWVDEKTQPIPQTDIQAIINVIGRRGHLSRENERINLSETDLRRYKFISGNFDKLVFYASHLENVFILKSSFNDAIFQEANLKYAQLKHSVFIKANFTGAILDHCIPYKTNFADAILEGASINCAEFKYVQGLSQNQIDDAYGDSHTSLPPGLKEPDQWI
jgi:hypothetical protein